MQRGCPHGPTWPATDKLQRYELPWRDPAAQHGLERKRSRLDFTWNHTEQAVLVVLDYPGAWNDQGQQCSSEDPFHNRGTDHLFLVLAVVFKLGLV